MRILLVEDDPMIGESICKALRMAQFTIDWTRDGISAELALEHRNHSLLLLDLGLPRKSGLDILKWLRAHSDPIPVMILTARDAVEDRVQGLNCGADDYLVKPFDLDELIARIYALLRRNSGRAETEIAYGNISLDIIRHEAKFKGAPITLTTKEFEILHALLEHPGVIVSREKLEERLYGWGEEIESNIIDVYIHHLRKKIGSELIHNVRGVGYKLGKVQ